MRKAVFVLLYALTLAAPLVPYLAAAGLGPDSYTVSVVLGISTIVLVLNQFILAARPAFAVKALGAQGLLALHRTVPAVIIVLAGAHLSLKLAGGFSPSSLRAALGFAAFLGLTLLAAFAALIMTNSVLARVPFLAAFKKAFLRRTGITYKKARTIHNAYVPVAVLILVHALLASSSDLSANPAGAAWLAFWTLLSLGIYARYRLRNRGGSDTVKSGPRSDAGTET